MTQMTKEHLCKLGLGCSGSALTDLNGPLSKITIMVDQFNGPCLLTQLAPERPFGSRVNARTSENHKYLGNEVSWTQRYKEH